MLDSTAWRFGNAATGNCKSANIETALMQDALPLTLLGPLEPWLLLRLPCRLRQNHPSALATAAWLSLQYQRCIAPVLQQQLEECLCLVLVQSTSHELVQYRGHLQAHAEHAALTLQAHILGPLHKAAQITLGGRLTSQTCGQQAQPTQHKPEGNILLE